MVSSLYIYLEENRTIYIMLQDSYVPAISESRTMQLQR